MLQHNHLTPQIPARVVVLGSGGFIGGAITRRLQQAGLTTLALGRPAFDLLDAGAADRLTAALQPADTLVFVSAKAPVKNPAMLLENLRMGGYLATKAQAKLCEHWPTDPQITYS